MGRPKKYDTTVRVRLNFMQHAFLKELSVMGGISMAQAMRVVVEGAMQDVLAGRLPGTEGEKK